MKFMLVKEVSVTFWRKYFKRSGFTNSIVYQNVYSLLTRAIGFKTVICYFIIPDSEVHGDNMGPTWVLSAPDGSHVGPMNLAIRGCIRSLWWDLYCVPCGNLHVKTVACSRWLYQLAHSHWNLDTHLLKKVQDTIELSHWNGKSWIHLAGANGVAAGSSLARPLHRWWKGPIQICWENFHRWRHYLKLVKTL